MVRKELGEGEPQTRHLIVAVMGVPGCGKTTFLGPLRECGFATIGEIDVKKIKSFQQYYQEGENPSVTFRTQVEFLLEKYWRIKGSSKRHFKGVEEIARKEPVAIEPPPWSDKIFGTARLEGDPVFLDLYLGVFDTLFPEEGSFKPDLIVYLRLSLEKMLKRIEDRAKECPERGVELGESPEYWRRVWELHEEWVSKNRESQEIITINGDPLDFSRFYTKEVGKEALTREFLAQTRYACIDPLTGRQKIPAEIIIPPSIVNYRPDPTA